MSGDQTVTIESRRFGKLELPERELLRFPGLPGFPAAERFAVVQHDRRSPFGWLVSADLPELAFVVTSPLEFFPDYDPKIDPAALRPLRGKDGDAVELLVIANVSQGEVALNLAAPLVIHPETRRGVQVVLEEGDWPSHQPLPPLEP